MGNTNNNKKGRMASAERDEKKAQAKKMFLKNIAMQNISEITGVGIKTLSLWRDEDNWQGLKDLQNMRPSEIKNLILEYVRDIKNGDTPRYKADDLAKISAAFNRLNDGRKKAVYTMESFDEFSEYMFEQAGVNTGVKRDELLNLLKQIRLHFEKYVNQLMRND